MTDIENTAFSILKIVLKNRNVVADDFVTLGILQDSRLFDYGGVLVVFSDKSRIAVDDIKKHYIEYATENNFSKGMVVVGRSKPSDTVVSFVRKHVGDEKNMLIQLFHLKQLQFDISAHKKYARKHRILTNEERDAVIQQYILDNAEGIDTNTVIDRFPRIDSQDPAIKWIGARPGDVIEVTGLCETSGMGTAYRTCVENAFEA
jgi:DNA-directed RNA polymerase subunit H (RpoH/RPB5)